MSRIRILSEHLANQIAAGEVVERPASVVKELVENSIDAGADRIEVQVEGSGTRLLRIADNGGGMNEDDVLLSIERHATSKLHEESQLNAIATLGFRGEALPSIGSVSKMIILSRPWDSETGTRAELRYGAFHAIHEAGCSKGTVIEVRNLFGNMPARKKFLKSARTEIYHIEEVIKNQALANPQIGFSLQVDNRLTLSFPPGGGLEQRVRDVFRYKGALLQVVHSNSTAGSLQLGGFLLLPEAAVNRTARLRILVNNRPVHDTMIRHAVMEGLKGFLMKGYQPAGALLLSISPEQVDVNVHPAKREIRFRKAQEVHRDIVAGVSHAMQAYQEEVRSDLFKSPQVMEQPDIGQHAGPSPAVVRIAEPQVSVSDESPAPALPVVPASLPGSSGGPSLNKIPKTEASIFSPPVESEVSTQESYGDLSLVGQILSLYLLCERDNSLVVIDQHAAHERILYGQLRQAYLDGEVPRQQLLFPVTVELGPDHMETLENKVSEVESLGLTVEHFGDTTWVIKAVPAVTSQVDPTELLYEVLEGLQGQAGAGSELVPVVVDNLMASMACKAAIKAGNRLQPEEMLALLRQMEQSEVFSHCPHGRPVMKIFSGQDIEKWFHRHGG